MQPELGLDTVPPIERLGAEVAMLRKRIADMLRRCGQPAVCTGQNCGQGILFIVHANGARTPYNHDGTLHFQTCIDRDQFSRRKTHGG